MFQTQTSFAQWTLDVVGTVKKEETKKRMEGSTITIKRNGAVWKTLASSSSGKFEASLEPGAVYIIEFSRPGHVTKRIQFSTKNVPPDDAKYGFEFPLEMNLFEKVDGLDVSILDQPIGKVQFDPETGYMDFDAAYTKSIKKELDRLKKELAEKLKSEEENRKAHQKDYDAAIAAADKLFKAEKWAEAKPLYEKAAGIFPDESYPEFQLEDISDKLAGMAEANKRYQTAIDKGDAAFKAREWDKATAAFENAVTLKDTEQYPKDKIKEIKTIIANQKKVDKEYKEAIASGDQQMMSRDYESAKESFTKAAGIKDYEQYPKDKLSEIDGILAEQAKKDQEYTDAIAIADEAFKIREYDKSIEAYKKASGLKPLEAYPKTKIDEATRLKAELKQLEENYKKFIADADAAFTAKDYAAAQSNYEQAAGLKDEEKYPKDQLIEIKALLEAANKLEADYANLIKEGDNAMASKGYDNAKTAFEKALALKSEEQYPQEKLKEIEGLLAELAKEEEAKKAKEEQYLALITEADKMLGAKDYENAKGKYTEALAIKSEEQHPKDKIKEIEGLLADLAKEEADKKAKEEQYLALITEADKMLAAKDYENARGKYTEALGIKSEEQHPKDKLKEIEDVLAGLAKEEADKKAKEEQYLALITEADKMLAAKDYENAKGKYTEALGIKSEEQHPKDKLKEIEDAIAELARKKAEEEAAKLAGEERDAKYNEIIALADKAFNTQKYDDAKLKYTEALGVKSEEEYPKTKLKEIEDAIAELARKKAEEEAAKMAGAEKDAKYKEAITLADNAFGFENFEQAKIKYNEALAVKPGEQYPKEKLEAVEAALLALAKKNEEDALALESERKKKEYFDALVAEGDAALIGKNYEEASSKYTQALGVIPGEKYPETKLEEIKAILAKIEAEKANDDKAKADKEKKYNEFITQANSDFEAKKYANAKINYQSALGVKQYESYPKNQITEIDRILAEIAAKESEITLTNNALKQKEEKYNALIKTADSDLEAKKYKKAISAYEQALGLMPAKSYPKEKIDAINSLLAELAAKEKEGQDAILAEKEKRKEYEQLIFDGDRSMKLKEYTNAQVSFRDALALYSTEKYPQDKLDQIAKILEELSKPEEIVVSNNSNTGTRAKINRDKEREIEARMAALLGKNIVKKDENLQKDKDTFKEQEEVRVSGGISRTTEADLEKSKYEEGISAQAERGNKFHLENSESLLATTKLLEKAESNRVKKADKRRNESDESFEVYSKEQAEFLKEQEGLSKDKAEAHYIYVDNVSEANLIMVEKGDKLRADNRVDLEEVKAETLKNEKRNKKKREERELDVKAYKKELTEGEEILVSAAIDRGQKNGEEIKEINESQTAMKAEKSNLYKLNVNELIKFKEKIDRVEAARVEKADKQRLDYKKVLKRIEDDAHKKSDAQNVKYYEDIVYLEEYKDQLTNVAAANVKSADKRRLKANQKMLKSKDRLGVVEPSQEKRYKSFQLKLEEERTQNNNFISDLQTIERTKMMQADADLEGFYMGEKRERENEELVSKYPQGITEETVEGGNSVVIKRIKVTGNHADVYERVFYAWGGTYFFKNGENITQALWDKESID